jgi:hypothetical protein
MKDSHYWLVLEERQFWPARAKNFKMKFPKSGPIQRFTPEVISHLKIILKQKTLTISQSIGYKEVGLLPIS